MARHLFKLNLELRLYVKLLAYIKVAWIKVLQCYNVIHVFLVHNMFVENT